MARTWNGIDAVNGGGGSGRPVWAVRILSVWKLVFRARAETSPQPARFAMFHASPRPTPQPIWRRIYHALARMEMTDAAERLHLRTAPPPVESTVTSGVQGALDPDALPVGLLDLIEASVDEIRSTPADERRRAAPGTRR